MNRTTAIGSLPHHNVDSAIEFAFRFDIPALPQIPIRNSHEYMLSQALDGLPGLSVEDDGMVSVDRAGFLAGLPVFQNLCEGILAGKEQWNFSAEVFSCWQPFLFELSERKTPMAKIQMAGPLTCQWVLSGSASLPDAALASAVVKVITVKTISMVRELKARGVQPVIFIDEPGLYAYSSTDPRHILAFQDLRFLVATLRKEGAVVGVHCCSNTDWRALLGLGLSVLSFDVALSLDSLLSCKSEVQNFLNEGGRFALGIIPTNLNAQETNISEIMNRVKPVLQHAWLTPACGLALKSVEEADSIWSRLKEAQRLLS